MIEKLNNLKKEFLEKLSQVKNNDDLKNLELKFLSRKGELSEVMKGIKDLNLELKKEVGELANKIKNELQDSFLQISNKLQTNKEVKTIDPTLPGLKNISGHLNPITLLQNELEDFFSSLGFIIEDGPEIESDYFNFTALNVPPLHPARDMQDTFYVDLKNKDEEYDVLMRTHTSSMQIRAILKYGAPLKVIVPGRVFRNEATDSRHEHTFYQFEGMMIGKNISFANLKSILELVGKRLFGPETKLRMRPKLYPFVEPGNNGEYTCFLCQGKGCQICKHSGWLEILGAGLIHPEVIKAGGLDPEIYSGYAFGFGLTRLAMLKYNINDSRLFSSGDIKFLEQF